MARYFRPSGPPRPATNPREELVASLSRINTFNPPVQTCSTGWRFSGLYSGPTSIAYLFWRLSQLYPDLTFKSQSLRDWAHAYLDLGSAHLNAATTSGRRRQPPSVDPSHCGIANEHLCQLAVRAVLLEDASLAQQLCSHSSAVNDDRTSAGSNEWLYGRAGYLYLVRLLLTAFPASSNAAVHTLLRRTIAATIARIQATPQPWTWHGKTYLGAAHGSIGIVTQILLSSSDPERHAAQLEPLLRDLLAQQTSTGNFPSSLESPSASPDRLVQFCHGAPGFVVSLQSVRRFFPAPLQTEIDVAIVKAERLVEDRGLLTKPPCLCHGVAGNAMALRDDPKFEEWLRYMSSESLEGNEAWMVEAGRKDDFVGLWTGEAGRAWVWAVAESVGAFSNTTSRRMEMGLIGYNDL